jgi:hypothetical protein
MHSNCNYDETVLQAKKSKEKTCLYDNIVTQNIDLAQIYSFRLKFTQIYSF